MPGALPEGLPAPASGELPATALAELGRRPFGLYVHVPFCASRCGYCDFNTYTAAELGAEPGTSQDAYLAAVSSEVRLAARVLGPSRPPVATVFFGGGTPTLLAPDVLTGILAEVRTWFDLEPGCEVTTEANPESVTADSLAVLRDGGINRVSFGMQSIVPHVLRVLERRHSPGRAVDAVSWARQAGFSSVSLDLIYGTPGESVADWEESLRAAIAAAPDHVSAYSLIVEEGTRLGHRVSRGEMPAPDEDDLADKYTVADDLLAGAGYAWYEVSNWARPGHACRHNLGYWLSADWWGIGPGAHSHVGGVRWWNVRHPRDYAAALASRSPAAGRELLTAAERRTERVLLESRLSTGLPVGLLGAEARRALAGLRDDGLVDGADPVVLTRRGRLLADLVARDLT
ncbi:radical SAM family heme chaperone HemW [Propionicicella superfundia]|uniref:radical SAM family heme chaperone HemW n=1 Tax=Propionicicella superfundia TaxID=348582 RepID=UPI000413950B|nr:radical SAM family heme chaperone HemW [Propionicicella superfundia]